MRATITRGITALTINYGRRRLELAALCRCLRDGFASEVWPARAISTDAASALATIEVELTNICRLRCPDCDTQHPDVRGAPGLMSADTFARLVRQVRQLRVRELRLCGRGEPLLHPDLAVWLPQLREVASLVTVTTNGQLLAGALAAQLLRSVDIVEVSVASDHVEGFQRSRAGGNFADLLANLTSVRALRRRMRSRTLLHLRVMVRPSELARIDRIVAFWRRFGDVVSIVRVVDHHDEDGDAFARTADARVREPSRTLAVRWDGEVPMPYGSGRRTDGAERPVLGNIHEMRLAELGRSPELWRYDHEPDALAEPVVPPVNGSFSFAFVPLRALLRRRSAERVSSREPAATPVD